MNATKIIKLGKIDYLGIGRKTCPVEVSFEIRDWNGYDELAICGDIYNHLHTDCYSCGQNLNTIAKYIKSKKFNEILRLWNAYHLHKWDNISAEDKKIISNIMFTNN